MTLREHNNWLEAHLGIKTKINGRNYEIIRELPQINDEFDDDKTIEIDELGNFIDEKSVEPKIYWLYRVTRQDADNEDVEYDEYVALVKPYVYDWQVRFRPMTKEQWEGEEPYDLGLYDEEIVEASDEIDAIDQFVQWCIDNSECRVEQNNDQIFFYDENGDLCQAYLVLKAVEYES